MKTITKMDDSSRFGGGTSAYQATIERKRAAIRQALRHEYLKVFWNPNWFNNSGRTIPFDTGMARYIAMDNTIGQRGPVMRPRHVATFIVTNVIPVGFIMFSIYNTKVERHRRYMSMEAPYDDYDRMDRWSAF